MSTLCLMIAAGPQLAAGFAYIGASVRPHMINNGRSAAVQVFNNCRSAPVRGLRMQLQDEKSQVKDPEEVTKKYGLEAGLFTALT
jgi:hypothetical protein